MSRIRTNLITNRMANGAPTVSHGLVVAGVTTVTGSINNLNLTGITTISTLDLNGDLDVDGHLNADNVSIAGVVTATSFVGDGSGLTGAGPSLTGSTNNTVVTVTGSNAVQGEANLTFDGTNLKIGNAGTDGVLRIRGAANSTQVSISDNTSATLRIKTATGALGQIFVESGQSLVLGTNNTEKLRIDPSYARVGINTSTFDTAGSQLKIEGRGSGTTSPPYLQIKGVGSGVLHSYVDLIATSANNAGSAYRGLGVVMLDEPTNVEWFSGRPYAGSDEYIISRKASPSYRTQSGEKANALFKVGSDGKLYKGGTQFYPLVNYTEVTTYSNSSTSSTSYVDLRTIYSSYTPKKAGNRIVIHHQSQMWNGAAANSNSDVYWKIQRQEGGGSWTDTIKNERILGNHDGHSYTGGSGLARHHRTVHLMGSFICAGSSINLKTLGKSVSGISWDWYHDGNNVLQIWEYDIS